MSSLVPEKIIKILDSNLVSLYHYQKEPELVIPVFVLKAMDFEAFDELKEDFEDQQFIILTHNDILRGNDIFPLKFLHMQHNSTLQYGNDSFAGLTIEKKYLRATIEFELRNKLIQLRESYLSFKGKREFLLYILPVMLMIWDGVLFLHDVHASPSYLDLKKQVKDIIHDDEDIFDALIDPSSIKDSEVSSLIQKISKYLEYLTKHIDQF